MRLRPVVDLTVGSINARTKSVDIKVKSMEQPSNANRRGFVVLVAAAGTWIADCAMVLADDLLSLRKARRRITPLCSVPNADYQHGARTPSVLVRSLPAVPQLSAEEVKLALDIVTEQSRSVTAITTEQVAQNPLSLEELLLRSNTAIDRRLQSHEVMRRAIQPKAKLMQLSRKQITIAHSALSDVALLIEPTGVWHLSLQGDQNFRRDDRNDARNDELQFKRNAFNVTMRLLRSSRSGGESLTPTVGGESGFDQSGKLVYAEIKIPEFWVQREAPQLITRMGHHPLIALHYDDIDQVEYEFFVRLDALTGSGEGVVQPWQPER